VFAINENIALFEDTEAAIASTQRLSPADVVVVILPQSVPIVPH
jgi:DNA-binding MurR/RpiR family transcriptional regulator